MGGRDRLANATAWLALATPLHVVSTLLGVVTAWYREPAVARRAAPTFRALAGSFPTSLLGDSGPERLMR
ncbi:MAG: hypothetical protein LC685_04200, partial [Actinobacteria bacterium]|nr:hypothetical protein [Actinomycetota bacterium]